MGWERAAAVLALLAAAGCSQAPLSAGHGGVDPAEAFAKMKAAQDAYDWARLYDQFTPESQRRYVLAVVLEAARPVREAGDARRPEPPALDFVRGILRRHGVSLDEVAKDLDKGEAALLKKLEGVADPRSLFADIQIQFAATPGYVKPKLVEVRGIEVEGDRARGEGVVKRKTPSGEETTTQEMRFRRVGDRWFLVLGDE